MSTFISSRLWWMERDHWWS